jgi:hypothetical protein
LSPSGLGGHPGQKRKKLRSPIFSEDYENGAVGTSTEVICGRRTAHRIGGGRPRYRPAKRVR